MPRKKQSAVKKILRPKIKRVRKTKVQKVSDHVFGRESHRALFASLIIIGLIGVSYLNNHIRSSEIYTAHQPTPNVIAKAVFAYDILEQKVLFEKNSTVPLPLASLTKIMTSTIAIENIESTDTVIISEKAFNQQEDQGLFVGEEWSRDDLVKFMILESSNDAAYAIGEKIGGIDETVALMNLKANEMGLSMEFSNVSGLDTPDSVGALGSAEDVARLLSYSYKNNPEIWDATTREKVIFQSISNFIHEAENTNYDAELHFILASKTGFTDRAGGNLAIMYNKGLDHPIIVVLLGSTLEGRFNDMKILLSAIRDMN
jgi:D-alanyl-D-alanine carboxypeptidase